ncbi:tail fiber domain-containing protein [Halalkalibacter alkaliphilus]|uniref:Tail fiber domain-containing protein n=1 Tax=Halalkalibacter alkaliphilus TaxID=2917993 RepID=A0A9X2CTH8_9BACI|nr:glycosyl hydrolase family 28-related protein [Halalkalibacter alkaliphilus]MCL7748046.1 tail fiber domain-containing protein [Halalkalibacter alkaliphilus]
MNRRNFLFNFFLWIFSFIFGYKIGNLNSIGNNEVKDDEGESVTDKLEAIHDRLNETTDDLEQRGVNVKKFGAKGDGKTDDTGAIQKALIAGAGRTVIFPKGRFIISKTLIIPSGTYISGENTYDTWDGENIGTSIITSGTGNPQRWTDIDGNDKKISPALVLGGNEIKIENLTVECNSYRWDVAIFVPSVKRTFFYNVDTVGPWKVAGIYLDATWSDRNKTLTSLHPNISPSTGMNEFHAESCFFRGLWGVVVQGTTRNPERYETNQWIWGWGGTSDLSFVNCRMGSNSPSSERRNDGGCFKHDAAMKNAAKAGQGHNFINCTFRTGSKYMIYLDRSNRDTFVNCYGETISNWEHGNAVFAVTSHTGEIARLNDKVMAPVTLNGEPFWPSSWRTPYHPDVQMVTQRTRGELYTPNFSGFGESSGEATEIISYFSSETNAGRMHFKHGDSIFADIDKGRLNLRDIPLLRFNNDFSFDKGTSRKITITDTANISYQEFRPNTDGTLNLGSSNSRWNTIYTANGMISTSDERMKQQISSIPDKWLDAWSEVNFCRFKFTNEVQKNGTKASWHVGVIAQQIVEAFHRHGLDAIEIGIVCYDEWEENVTETLTQDADGNTKKEQKIKKAGSIWSVRFDECQFLEMALNRRENEKLRLEIDKFKSI